MYFLIQVSNPVIQSQRDNQVENLTDAIETIFPYDTEDAYFLWNSIPIRVNYKYDLSVLIYKTIPLLDAMIIFKKGVYSVNWHSEAFSAIWSLEWVDNRVNIVTQWHGVAGSYEDLLNNRSQLQMEQDIFLGEWKTLLRKIIEAIDTSGIIIADRKGLDDLRRIEASIVGLGSLYEVNLE